VQVAQTRSKLSPEAVLVTATAIRHPHPEHDLIALSGDSVRADALRGHRLDRVQWGNSLGLPHARLLIIRVALLLLKPGCDLRFWQHPTAATVWI